MLVGNQCDVPKNHRQISRAQGKEMAEKLGGGRIIHCETSALYNINVTEAR